MGTLQTFIIDSLIGRIPSVNLHHGVKQKRHDGGSVMRRTLVSKNEQRADFQQI